VVTLRTGIHFLDFESGELELVSPLADPPPHVFNDGKVDSRGRFIIGASTANFAKPAPDGGLFRFGLDRTLTRLDSGIHFSNSACWSPDGERFYFSDSWLNTTYAYDYDIETGSVSNRRIFVNTTPLGGLPDGATVESPVDIEAFAPSTPMKRSGRPENIAAAVAYLASNEADYVNGHTLSVNGGRYSN